MIDDHQVVGALIAYETWFALRQYFRDDSKYDYFKYNGKILKKSVKDKFASSKYAHSSVLLFNRYRTKEELEKAIVANLLVDSNTYITSVDYDVYKESIKKYESILYTFEQDLKTIFGNDVFLTAERYFQHTEDYSYSYIYELYINKEITIETLIILDSITKFLQKIERDHSDFIFREEIQVIKKYKKFFIQWQKYYITDYKKILKKVLTEFHHV